ncbi:hypothetical protein T492DRAFT_887691 [Pavlovales sp. CCMP2436]|nr:hypothetical protein T492DRAFT_887691 [Pavlovales sp. CCMP2436]
MLLSVAQLKVEAERYGAPSRETVERALVEHALETEAARAALKEAYRKAQFGDFRAQQSDRHLREAAELAAQRIVLADDHVELARVAREAQEAVEADERALVEATAAEVEAKRLAAAAVEAERMRAEEERRQVLMSAISMPKPKEVVKHEQKDTGPAKDVHELNAERLERIGAIQQKLDGREEGQES